MRYILLGGRLRRVVVNALAWDGQEAGHLKFLSSQERELPDHCKGERRLTVAAFQHLDR